MLHSDFIFNQGALLGCLLLNHARSSHPRERNVLQQMDEHATILVRGSAHLQLVCAISDGSHQPEPFTSTYTRHPQLSARHHGEKPSSTVLKAFQAFTTKSSQQGSNSLANTTGENNRRTKRIRRTDQSTLTPLFGLLVLGCEASGHVSASRCEIRERLACNWGCTLQPVCACAWIQLFVFDTSLNTRTKPVFDTKSIFYTSLKTRTTASPCHVCRQHTLHDVPCVCMRTHPCKHHASAHACMQARGDTHGVGV